MTSTVASVRVAAAFVRTRKTNANRRLSRCRPKRAKQEFRCKNTRKTDVSYYRRATDARRIVGVARL
jgi:hypothetical protein